MMATPAPLGHSIAEAVYSDTATAKVACQEHAKASGFEISVGSSSALRVFYNCTKSREKGRKTIGLWGMIFAFKESFFILGIPQFLTFLATCRDLSAFKYILSSSTLAVLGCGRQQPPQSTAVSALIA
jgi:hypothetical protein